MSDRLVIRDWESVLVRNEKKLSGRVRPAGPLAYLLIKAIGTVNSVEFTGLPL
jgi:hypothetical protein